MKNAPDLRMVLMLVILGGFALGVLTTNHLRLTPRCASTEVLVKRQVGRVTHRYCVDVSDLRAPEWK